MSSHSINPPDQPPTERPDTSSATESTSEGLPNRAQGTAVDEVSPSLQSVAEGAWDKDGTPTKEQREMDNEHFSAWMKPAKVEPRPSYVWNAACAYARRHFAPLLANTVRRGAYDYLAALYRKLEATLAERDAEIDRLNNKLEGGAELVSRLEKEREIALAERDGRIKRLEGERDAIEKDVKQLRAFAREREAEYVAIRAARKEGENAQ